MTAGSETYAEVATSRDSLKRQVEALYTVGRRDRAKVDKLTTWVTRVADLDYGLGDMDIRQLVIDARAVLKEVEAISR